jgi:hypothetical protein
MTNLPNFLPGVPADYVLDRLAKAGGNEVESGKLLSPESSAALAVNCFSWFAARPSLLPEFPGLKAGYPASTVDVEYRVRFPWTGGRHPWLDAFVTTPTHLIGVESKRYEPYRDKKAVVLSDAYDRPVWGEHMGPFERARDALKSGAISFQFLDAAQLVKHAFGLVTEAGRLGKSPVLVYLFAEPAMLAGRPIPSDHFSAHRAEVQSFAELVDGAAVGFHATSYRDWLDSWSAGGADVAGHGDALLTQFSP